MEINEVNKQLLLEFAEYVAVITLSKVGAISEHINQSEAYKTYGKANVRNWVKWSLVQRIKEGERNSNVRYSRVELESAAKSNNRLLYFVNTPGAGSSFEEI